MENKPTTITLTFDSRRLEALEIFLKKESNATVQKKMDEALRQLYDQTVPKPVQEFLDGVAGVKPKRPAAPKPKPPVREAQNTAERKETTGDESTGYHPVG